MKPCGRSTFFQLRPKNVIEVGASGTHNMCVSEKHENVKLMLDSIISIPEKCLLMEKLVCDIKNSVCMLRRCDKCPGKKHLINHLKSIISESKDVIKFRQWECTDCNILLEKELVPITFVNLLAEKIDKLTTHHFISKKNKQISSKT